MVNIPRNVWNRYLEHWSKYQETETKFFSNNCRYPDQRRFLRVYRLANGWSLDDVVDMINKVRLRVGVNDVFYDGKIKEISKESYKQLERGNQKMSPEVFRDMCYILKVRSSDVIEDSEELASIVHRGSALDYIKDTMRQYNL